MIDWSKPIEANVSGSWLPARKLGELHGRRGARCVVYDYEGAEFAVTTWGVEAEAVIRNVPEPKEHGAGYVNIYGLRHDVARRIEAPGIGIGHKTRKEADFAARLAERADPRFPRIACRRVEWEEGQFDD